MLYPLKFKPVFKERIWGGRELQRLFGKPLPPSQLIGESWELTDRPGESSIITNGRFTGKTLRWLLELHAEKILGSRCALPLPAGDSQPTPHRSCCFPLLVKWLDARALLSVQVHPPPHVAARLGGEPKTEMWWVADAAAGAEIYLGLKQGVTRQQFSQALAAGNVADCLHRVPVKRGDVFYIPAGRVHALGAGVVVLEIQQNSDTTYRVFDWNRKGDDDKPRELHVAQALESIDFSDYEPSPLVASPSPLVSLLTCPYFTAHHLDLTIPLADRCDGETFQILAQLRGGSLIASRTTPPHESFQEPLNAGDVVLLPAALGDFRVEPLSQPCELLKVTVP